MPINPGPSPTTPGPTAPMIVVPPSGRSCGTAMTTIGCGAMGQHIRCYSCGIIGYPPGSSWTNHCVMCGYNLPAGRTGTVSCYPDGTVTVSAMAAAIASAAAQATALGPATTPPPGPGIVIPKAGVKPNPASTLTGLWCKRCRVESTVRNLTTDRLRHWPCGTPLVVKTAQSHWLTPPWQPTSMIGGSSHISYRKRSVHAAIVLDFFCRICGKQTAGIPQANNDEMLKWITPHTLCK